MSIDWSDDLPGSEFFPFFPHNNIWYTTRTRAQRGLSRLIHDTQGLFLAKKKSTLMIIIILMVRNESDFFFFWHIKCACSLQQCLRIFIAAHFLLSIFFNFIFNYLRFIFNYKLFYYVLLRPLIPHATLIFLVLSRLVSV